MHEVRPQVLTSLSLFVGTGVCNANCPHCAGVVHRKFAPQKDGVLNEELITKTLRACYKDGARYLTLSSGGEPTLSPRAVARTLEIVSELKKEGIVYAPINLYSNGIRIGRSAKFASQVLPKWKALGLACVYVTVHDTDAKKNAEVYGVKFYPSLKEIILRIHKAGILMRANLVLSKSTVSTAEKFIRSVIYLKNIGADSISAWPVRGEDDRPDKENVPPEEEMDKMDAWIALENSLDFKIRLLRERDREVYQEGRKLTLFPDGTLSGTWCNH